MNEWNPAKKDPKLKKELGFEEDARIVLSLRQLKPIYDIPTFIRSIPLIAEKEPRARFIVASDGPDKQSLVEMSKSLGVADKVRFTGFMSSEELQRYAASSDIYVSSSLSDAGLAASTAEAMASQVASVITDFGNNKDWIEDGVNGFLFPMKDHHALAEKVLFLIQHPDIARQYALKGRETIQERNNWRKQMESVERLYEQMILTGKKKR